MNTRERSSGAGKPPEQSEPAPSSETAKPERIAKRMARAGLCSRRQAEAWIADGRVKLNGKVLQTPAVTVTDADRIEVDGEALRPKERTRLWLYHKPSGLVTTNRDPEGRRTVFDALPENLPRVISVGRLDINTEGLMLLTNDGGLARVLELPETGWLRRYRVRVHGSVTQQQLDTLKDGIAVDGVLYGSIEAVLERTQGTNAWITMAFREGKNREVKQVLSALGLTVTRLIRISYGPFQLGDLEPGAVREIRGRTLRDQLGARLIEKAGAQFESALPKPDKPVSDGPKKKRTAGKKADGSKQRKAAGQRASTTEQALGKLSTRPRKSPKKPAGSTPRKGKPGADRRR